MSRLDRLRLPASDDPSASAYKDWFHLNLFDHRSGRVGLINLSLHGAPSERASRAIGAALLHDPELGWLGNVATAGVADALISPSSISLGQVAFSIDVPGERLHASASLPEDEFKATISAQPAAAPHRIELPSPFGRGWIAWFVQPRLKVEGACRLLREDFRLDGASAYHDHNWGRWHWGDDIGWEWGAFVAEAPGPVFVLSRLTDAAHARCGVPQLMVDLGRYRRLFGNGAVTVELDGWLNHRLRRLPGALAALHQDRVRPDLPARVTVRAAAGLDWIHLEFAGRAAAQLIAGDPAQRGYGFINEIVGDFRAAGRIRDADISAGGLAVFEYVQ